MNSQTATLQTLAPSASNTPIGSWSFTSPLLTARGLILTLFALYLALGPAQNYNDILASSISYSIIALLVTCISFTILQAFVLRKNLKISMFSPISPDPLISKEIIAGTASKFLIKTSTINILPFYVLNIKVKFLNQDIETSIHKLAGRYPKERTLIEALTFPHRGEWQIKHLELSFGDQLGLSSLNWTYNLGEAFPAIEVKPRLQASINLPLLSSCNKAGDLLPDTQERQGDPYDLKRYHPADGLRKVVWKIFARSGDLVSRHQEQSITPEGRVLIYVAATKSEDHLCSAAINYLNYAQEIGLEALTSCNGNLANKLATGLSEALSILIESTWQSDWDKFDQVSCLGNFINNCRNQSDFGTISNILIFINRDGSQQSVQHYLAMGQAVSTFNIKPVFAVIRDTTYYSNLHANLSTSSKNLNRLQSWFVHQDHPTDTNQIDQLTNIINFCNQNGWEVYS